MDGRLGTAPDRSNLVLLAAQLIVEQALEAKVRDEVGRARYERTEGEASGYRNGYRRGRMKTAEGMVESAAPQVRDTTDPPPLKWSALRYGFRAKEDHDAEEETQA
jgi:transposase-like protein